MRVWKREDFLTWLSVTLCTVVGTSVATSTEPLVKAIALGVLSAVTTGAAFYFLAWFVLWRKQR
ncbi:MAG TPA: hypothetical protein VF322_12325 [Gammaproteobacteria bacterium]